MPWVISKMRSKHNARDDGILHSPEILQMKISSGKDFLSCRIA
jgi:hypothetical protein